MPPKALVTTPTTATTSDATTSGGDTSMQDDDLQVVTQGQLKEFTEQMNNN